MKAKASTEAKSNLHPRSRHHGRYDLDLLIKANPELAEHVNDNKYGNRSIDFFNPQAVYALNKSLLLHHYDMKQWPLPKGYLCPPIPGRADYIHHMADVLATYNDGKIPLGTDIRCMDIGVGASCIYPILGRSEYGWSFIGSDIDEVALTSAKSIVAANPLLSKHVHCRLQSRVGDILHGVLDKGEHVDALICNPPFHASAAEAQAGSIRKLSNLKGKKVKQPVLNFGGQANELWTDGGERKFILDLIAESKSFAKSCLCFSTLVSKESNLKPIKGALKQSKVEAHQAIAMGQGNKVSRILTWTFLTADEQREWAQSRWRNASKKD